MSKISITSTLKLETPFFRRVPRTTIFLEKNIETTTTTKNTIHNNIDNNQQVSLDANAQTNGTPFASFAKDCASSDASGRR